MASIQSSRTSKYARHGMTEDDPVEHVESAGEILIKHLVQKQTNTNITLDQQLQEEKKFERGVGFVSLDEIGAGSTTLQQFEERKQQAERLGELLNRGLSRQEALSLVTNIKNSKATPEAQATLQRLIQPPFSPINKSIPFGKRQEQELALSVKPNSLETRLYQFAVSNESAEKRLQCDNQLPDHPIHQLAAMERSLSRPADPQKTARTIKRKWRQQVEAMSEPVQVCSKPPDKNQSLWDAIEPPVVENKSSTLSERKVTCNKQTFYTIREGEIIKLESISQETNIEPISPKFKPSGNAFVSLQNNCKCPEITGKLSENEIKQITRFKNYDRGKESKILYIKNLSHHVTEDDLAAIFDEFQKPCDGKIIFRLMTGKMRGQAFITFRSGANATAALQTLNGSILKGKPIVIQYGKEKD